MNDLAVIPPPAAGAVKSDLERLLDDSGATFMAAKMLSPCHGSREMREAIRNAEVFLRGAQERAQQLRTAAERLSDDDVGRQLMAFVTAWPNAGTNDLAGYGAQLLDDVLAEEPCRHALAETLRKLRRTSRFLPSIADVLLELEVHQKRVRNTLFHIQSLPALIETLTIMADNRDRVDAEQRARREKAAASPTAA